MLYQGFVEEQLRLDSKIGIFVQLKEVMIKTCKWSNKGVKTKYKNRVVTLKEKDILISRIAMISGSRDNNMKDHV